MNARKKSNSIKTNVFSTFLHSTILSFPSKRPNCWMTKCRKRILVWPNLILSLRASPQSGSQFDHVPSNRPVVSPGRPNVISFVIRAKFWIWAFLDLQNLTIFGLFIFFSKIWKDDSSNIGFSVKYDPIRFNFQFSKTFRWGAKRWKTKKSDPVYPKLTYTSPRNKCTKFRKLRFFDFSFFSKNLKNINRNWDSPWNTTPSALIFR